MNYIKQLQQTNTEQATEIDALRKGINELRRYVASEKFATDTTVQVRDIETRLLEVMLNATHAADSAA